ncbi:MAG: transfer agent like protein [Tardiphaga sp.]|nr:transfer agent like protein [Tardiphaga sp.]
MADDDLLATGATLNDIGSKTKRLESSAKGFASAMTHAFSSAIVGGKQFDEVLKNLALKLSDMTVKLAFKPLAKTLTSGLTGLLSGMLGGIGGAFSGMKLASGGVRPFASGGVIGTPSYFPMMDGGVGLAGEAGPEAIMPLRRGPDGRLGVAGGGGGNTINVQIATPDAESFRRSESYITGQIARAVARGQRSL